MEREDLKEFGKHYIVIYSIIAYIIVVVIGLFFIRKGGRKECQ